MILFWSLLMAFVWFESPKISYKKGGNSHIKNATNVYIFKEDELSISSDNDNITGNMQMSYHGIKKVYETEKMFYLYINPRVAYLVDKSRIENGTAMDIRNLLLSKVAPKMYVICK